MTAGTATTAAGTGTVRPGRSVAVLVAAQLLSGVGVASSVAVGGVLAEQVSGTSAAAGVAQTASIVGAGLVSVPLAELASRHGRRAGLGAGFGLGAVGAAVVLVAAVLGWLPLMLLGMLAFGSSTAAGLQSRYAAAEVSSPARRARTMSLVVWSTTVGSVVGPNLSQAGADLGTGVGLPALAGPYLISVTVFVLAAAVLWLGLPVQPAPPAADGPRVPARRVLLDAMSSPTLRLGIVAVVCGHAMMVSVMVMTPVHMTHQGMSLTLVGLVISIHVLGMYAASPLFGWLADRFGSRLVLGLGVALFVLAFLGGALAPDHHGLGSVWLSVALGLLGLGWSACLIGGSALMARGAADATRVRLQGQVDSAMSLVAAATAAVSGPVLALGGYPAVNLVGAGVLAVLVVVALTSSHADAAGRT
ncbi:MFS transporter [Auraticoccus monumenti]|uniref:Predicted arabinose efflux permease, MFS family n=1 Tax=Auraticoccus monumenti TaxID=675864 RepID=A0A1G6YYK2_9ACTN|nr:MFS transporter [Auraticoccus monumenti]SDD95450.1 Predicted arabinose efflux permease, MFS family [Auraticoccus monumenti]